MYYYLSQWVKSGHYNTENEIRIKYPAIKKMTKSEINRTDKTYFKKKTYGWHLYTAFKKVFKNILRSSDSSRFEAFWLQQSGLL